MPALRRQPPAEHVRQPTALLVGGAAAARTLLPAALRGTLLDLLATGDVHRTTAAVHATYRPRSR